MNCRRILPHCLIFLTIAAFGANFCAAQTASRTHAGARAVKQKRSKRKPSRRVLHIHQAFVASKNLRLMAQQLLRERTPAGYRGVEAYARQHNAEDAGALAWFVVAYAHMLDHNPAEALDPLRRAQAKAQASELADYVTYYQASALQQIGSFAQAEALLRNFEQKFSGSIFTRDVHVTRAHALIALERPAEAIAILEEDRQPTRADIELTLGRAYAVAGQPAKAAAGALRNARPVSICWSKASATPRPLPSITP